jgi:3-oxoacyl-[acyl-carrier protein] reductase
MNTKNPTSATLAGKVALVTGASKGIGAAIARHLAAEGASVIVNYASDRAGADRVVAQIVDLGGKAVVVQADVAKHDDIKRLIAESVEAFGKLDVLVNNAGVFEFLPLGQITEEHFHRQFNINVLGVLLTTQEAVNHFPETGGSVINVSSIVSRNALPGAAVYSATKGALDVVTRVLSTELGPRKIRVNSLGPGMVETEGFHTAGIAGSAQHQQVVKATPLGRLGQPDDIAKVAVFLASDASGWVSGEALYAGGGHR